MTKKIDLDHIAINVKNKMDEAYDLFTNLGFTLTPRGFHSLGSINHSMIFNQDYLELIGFPHEGTVKRPELVNAENGINGLVFKSSNIEKTFLHLKNKNIHSEKPRSFSRPVKLNNIKKNAEFKTVSIDKNVFKAGRVYYCQHLTSELVWIPKLKNHKNTSVGITKFIIIDDNPDLIAKNFLKLNKYIIVKKSNDYLNLEINNTNLCLYNIEEFKLKYEPMITNMVLKKNMFASVILKVKSLSFFHHLKNKKYSHFEINIKKSKVQVLLKPFNTLLEFTL